MPVVETIPVKGRDGRAEAAQSVISMVEERGIRPRAADSYFTATAKRFNALPRDMVSRARKLNVPAFHVLDDSDRTQLLETLGGVV